MGRAFSFALKQERDGRIQSFQDFQRARRMGRSSIHCRSPAPRLQSPQALGRLLVFRRRPLFRQPHRRVQVKSTSCRVGTGYFCQFKPNYLSDPYTLEQLDFFAAYVIMQDAWYLIPARVLLGGPSNKQGLHAIPHATPKAESLPLRELPRSLASTNPAQPSKPKAMPPQEIATRGIGHSCPLPLSLILQGQDLRDCGCPISRVLCEKWGFRGRPHPHYFVIPAAAEAPAALLGVEECHPAEYHHLLD